MDNYVSNVGGVHNAAGNYELKKTEDPKIGIIPMTSRGGGNLSK